MKFIETVDLHVPEAQTPIQETTTHSRSNHSGIFSLEQNASAFSGSSMSSAICTEPLMDAIYDLLKAVKSPLAPGFWELKESWSIGNLERVLAGHGYKVQETWTAIST